MSTNTSIEALAVLAERCPSLNKLVADCRKRLVDAVVVYRYDRFARRDAGKGKSTRGAPDDKGQSKAFDFTLSQALANPVIQRLRATTSIYAIFRPMFRLG